MPANFPPYGRGRSRDANQMWPSMVIEATVRDNDSKPLLPADILKVLPHDIMRIERSNMPHELMNDLDFRFDTGAMLNAYKLSIILKYCTAYPQHVKAIYNSADGDFRPIPLAGAIGNSDVLKTLSAFLPVFVHIYTPYIHVVT